MNIREIARLAGVSIASVSRVLNGAETEKVSARTREKVLRICKEHRYAPNGHMLRMVGRRANTMVLLLPGNNQYGTRMDDNLSAAILGIEEELSLSSTFLLLAVLHENVLASKAYIKFYQNKTVDGVLVWGWVEGGGGYLKDLIGGGVPTVLLQGEA